uniref:Innexin n=1 Tax=Ditylenchus dipsaci TaxID=166011 RepID=A0A915EEZ1_9BILA
MAGHRSISSCYNVRPASSSGWWWSYPEVYCPMRPGCNMVNEKIFVLLWWWLIILNALTVASLVHWLVKLSLRSSRLRAFHDKLVLSVQRVHPEPPTEDCVQEKDNEESQSDNYDSNKEEEEGDNYDEEDSTTNKPPSDASTDKTSPMDTLQAPPIPTKSNKTKTQRRHDVLVPQAKAVHHQDRAALSRLLRLAWN